MGRHSTCPYILDELKTVSITDLKRWGYLQPGYRSGSLSWSFRGTPTGTAGITGCILPGNNYIELAYTCNHEQEYRYRVQLVATKTNLGIGQRWYFICPRTWKRCTNLHLGNGYFQHRSGIPGAMYDSQTKSGFYRRLAKFHRDHDRQFTPYMKTHYRGKPTKRYLRACIAASKADRMGAWLLASMKD